MTPEPSSFVKYSVLIQEFKQAKIVLETARKKKKDAKIARHKGENEDISKQELHILVFDHKREKHRFKARKLKLKLIKEKLRLWFKLNPKETTPEMLAELGETKVKSAKAEKHSDAENVILKHKHEKQPKIKAKKVKAESISDVVKEGKAKHKKDHSEEKSKKNHSNKKGAKLKLNVSEKLPELTPIASENKRINIVSSENTTVLTDFVKPVTISNDLTIIEGIGPKVQSILNSHNIYSFSDLVQTTTDSMRQILKTHKLSMIDPTTWAEQAHLVIENKMDELKALQVELKGGKRV